MIEFPTARIRPKNTRTNKGERMMIYYIETKETKMLLANVDSFETDEFHAKALDKKGRELFVCSKELLKVAHVVKDEKTFSSSNWGKCIINANTVWDD